MKTKLNMTTVGLLALTLSCTSVCRAGVHYYTADPGQVAVDAVFVRPCCLVATALGSVLFVVSLPFALPSKSVRRAAHSLVISPAKSTFTRPLGDLMFLDDYDVPVMEPLSGR